MKETRVPELLVKVLDAKAAEVATLRARCEASERHGRRLAALIQVFTALGGALIVAGATSLDGDNGPEGRWGVVVVAGLVMALAPLLSSVFRDTAP